VKIIENSKLKMQKVFLRSVGIALLGVLASVAAFAQSQEVNISSQAALVTEFEVNGMKVLVKRRPNSPTVAAGLFIRGGVRGLTPQNAGIESFTLDVATDGSKKFPREALRREFASTGSSVDSSASNDFSVVSLGSTLANFDRSWDVFTDLILNPQFDPADISLARDRTLTALRNQGDDPDSGLQTLNNRVIYAGHPYANDPQGTAENIARFTQADLRAYHQKLLQTSRLLLVVVGDLEPNDLRRRITESFGKLPRGDYKDQPYPTLDFSKPTLDISTRTLPTNYVQGVFAAPPLSDPDYYPMLVAIKILQSRVFQEVRVARQLSYAPNADLNNLAANTGTIYVTAVDANQSIKIMLGEIDKLKTTQITEEEISGVAGLSLTTYYLGQETNAAQAIELARFEMIGGGWRNSFDFLNRVKKVTADDVQRASKKYMKNLRFVVLGNPDAVNRDLFLQK
jgi:zinc protease